MLNKYLPEGSLIATPENREYISSLQGLERARSEGKILEGIVTKCDSNSMRLYVDLYGITGIIEREECLLGDEIKDIAIITRVGKAVAFKVMQIERKGGEIKAILSRRAAQRECMENFISRLCCGDVIPAKVTHMETFGAFVDIGVKQDGLIHISQFGAKFIKHPMEVVAVGDIITVRVLDVDLRRGRIALTMRKDDAQPEPQKEKQKQENGKQKNTFKKTGDKRK